MYLASTVGMIFGLACVNAVMQFTLRQGLESRLLDLGLGRNTRAEVSLQ